MHYKVYGYQGDLLLSLHFEGEVFGVTVIELLVPHLLLRHLSALSLCLHTFGPKVLRRHSPLLSQQICFSCLCRVIMVTLKSKFSSVACPILIQLLTPLLTSQKRHIHTAHTLHNAQNHQQSLEPYSKSQWSDSDGGSRPGRNSKRYLLVSLIEHAP